MKGIALAVVLVVSLAAPAWAGYEEGVAAYGRGNFPAALREFQVLVRQGDAAAQFYLGIMYDRGEGVAQDPAEAAKWYRRAAEQGHANAQFYLGILYDTGMGVAQDQAESLKWYRLAAEQGVANAQYSLGIIYDKGEGVAQDYAKAASWYRRAAERDFAKAQFSLGVMYEKGLGVPQDYAEAVKWYRLAAAQGNAKAMNNIGLFYQNGFDVPRDLAKAYAWYSLSADSFGAGPNREMVARNRDGVAKEFSPQQLEQAQRLAQAWSPGAASLAAAASPTRAFVALVQDKLLRSGHDPGPVDGLIGSGTRAAIRAFQAVRQIPITGKISEELLRELNTASLERTAPPPTSESSAPAAPTRVLFARVQDMLARSGHDPGPADGILGPKTRAAIRAFQAAKKIPVTGEVSAELLRELKIAPAD